MAAPTAERAGKAHGAGLFKGWKVGLGKGRGEAAKQQQQQQQQATPAAGTCKPTDPAGSCAAPGQRSRAFELASSWRGGHGHHHHHGGGSGAGAGSDDGIPLNVVKLLLTACLTSLNVACWLVPLKVRRFTESKLAISMANAFSGGVFLSLAFGHMLPHATHGFAGSGLAETVPYYLTLTGYLLIFFVEKIAFDAHELLHDEDVHDSHSGSGSGSLVIERSPGGAAHVASAAGHRHGHSHGSGVDAALAVAAATAKPNAAAAQRGGNNGLKQQQQQQAQAVAAASSATSGRSATILLLALSVHSLFETMALGLSSSKLNVCLLAMSIGLHQPAESLALLVSFLKSGLPQGRIVRMLSLFSCVGPLGVAGGVLVAQYAGVLADAVLVAMAAGTFVYVGATEVVADEFETPHHKWKKFGALLGGVVLIGYITSLAEALEHRAT